MSIKLKGSTDGSVTLQAPADTSPTGTDKTLTLPTTEGSANQFIKNGSTAGSLEYSSMVEDSSGNVGIGTSSPARPLHVQGTTADTFARIGNNSGGSHFGVVSGGDVVIESFTTDKSIKFYTSSFTERVNITGGGNVIYNGATAAHGALFAATSGSNEWVFGPNNSTAYVVYNSSGAGVYITSGNTSWSGTSDERLKADLIPIENGLDKVETLRAVTGRFTTDESGVSRSFLIAQDVQAVLPEAVDASNEDALGLRYTEVIPLLVAALKESKERIETLEAKVAALEAVE